MNFIQTVFNCIQSTSYGKSTLKNSKMASNEEQNEYQFNGTFTNTTLQF